MEKDLIQKEVVERKIYLIRGQRVMLSTDLAELYEVETRALVQAVKRNMDRFPGDFMFQLTPKRGFLFTNAPASRKRFERSRFKITNCDLETRTKH